MIRTLIIGIGNPLRGDDALGCRAIEELGRRLPPVGTDVITCHQLTPELAERVSRAERVIFIDSCAGSPPAQIRVKRLRPESTPHRHLTHHLDPQALMQYSRELFGKWPEAWTVSMTGARYEYAESLSSEVKSQMPALVDIVTHAALEGAAWFESRSGVHANG